MFNFELLTPTGIDQVLEVLDEYHEESSLIAGGAFLTIALKLGLISSQYLVSLQNILSLKYIKEDSSDGTLRLGALTTHREVEMSDLCRQDWPLLSQTYAKVANVRIRNQATIGGNLAAADYASDPPSALIALNAQVRLVRRSSERVIPVSDLITGHYATTMEPGELLTEVIVPKPPLNTRCTYVKYKSRSSEDRPCASVAATLQTDEKGRCTDLRVVIGAASERPHINEEALALAKGETITPSLITEIARRYAETLDPIDDLRGSAWYRRQVSEVLVQRAITDIAQLEAVT